MKMLGIGHYRIKEAKIDKSTFSRIQPLLTGHDSGLKSAVPVSAVSRGKMR